MNEFENKGATQNPDAATQTDGGTVLRSEPASTQDKGQVQDSGKNVNLKTTPPSQDDFDRLYRKTKELESDGERKDAMLLHYQRELEQAKRVSAQQIAASPDEEKGVKYPPHIEMLRRANPEFAEQLMLQEEIARANIEHHVKPFRDELESAKKELGSRKKTEEDTRIQRDMDLNIGGALKSIGEELGLNKWDEESRELVQDKAFFELDEITRDPQFWATPKPLLWTEYSKRARLIVQKAMQKVDGIRQNIRKVHLEELKKGGAAIPPLGPAGTEQIEEPNNLLEQARGEDGRVDQRKLRDLVKKKHGIGG